MLRILCTMHMYTYIWTCTLRGVSLYNVHVYMYIHVPTRTGGREKERGREREGGRERERGREGEGGREGGRGRGRDSMYTVYCSQKTVCVYLPDCTRLTVWLSPHATGPGSGTSPLTE